MYAEWYLLKLKLAMFVKQKTELSATFDKEEIHGVTPENLAETIEGHDELIDKCKKCLKRECSTI